MFVLDAIAGAQSVARGARRTRTDGHVIGGVALRFGAARSGARVDALLMDAGTVQRTVGVAEALGSAANVRIAVRFGQAFADGVGVLDATAGVAAARRRDARVGRGGRRRFGNVCEIEWVKWARRYGQKRRRFRNKSHLNVNKSMHNNTYTNLKTICNKNDTFHTNAKLTINPFKNTLS